MIQQRQRVAHSAIGAASDKMQRVVLDLQLLSPGHRFQPGDDGVRADAAEVEALQSRQNRCRRIGDLLWLGGRKHEHDAGRRLLENLEQRVPRLAGEHVRFVDDVNL